MSDDAPEHMTPEDLASYELRRATRGYAVAEVDDLLDRLAAQLEDMADERAGLQQQVADGLAEQAELRQRLEAAEATADRVVEAAREVADAVVADARREADSVLARARERAAEVVREEERRARLRVADAEDRVRDAEDRVERLRTFVDDHRARISDHLRRELSRLDAMVVPAPPAGRPLAPDPMVEAEEAAGPAPEHDPRVVVDPGPRTTERVDPAEVRPADDAPGADEGETLFGG